MVGGVNTAKAELRSFVLALHELDPVFRKVTLENDRLRVLVRDLRFHKDPVGMAVISCVTYQTLTKGRVLQLSNRW